jgi:hypothetical protein
MRACGRLDRGVHQVVAICTLGGANVMLPNTLKYGVVFACAVVAVASLTASAGDKKDAKSTLAGTWGKKGAELKIEFADKQVFKLVPHGDSAVIAIVCKYTVEKEGRVKAEITDFEGKAEFKNKLQGLLPVGVKFNFQWKVTGDTARLDDVKGDDVALLKAHLEGDFEKK